MWEFRDLGIYGFRAFRGLGLFRYRAGHLCFGDSCHTPTPRRHECSRKPGKLRPVMGGETVGAEADGSALRGILHPHRQLHAYMGVVLKPLFVSLYNLKSVRPYKVCNQCKTLRERDAKGICLLVSCIACCVSLYTCCLRRAAVQYLGGFQPNRCHSSRTRS